MAEEPRPSRAAGTGAHRRRRAAAPAAPTVKVEMRRPSEVEAVERRERQIAAIARLIREAAIRRRDRRPRRRP